MSGLKIQKVFIVDDHELVRQGLRQLINGEFNLELCGEAAGVSDTLKLCKTLKPDITIVDISLPDGNGLELVKQLHRYYPHMRIIVLSMHDDELYAERALNCGAMAYINKQDSAQKLLFGIKQVLNNKVFVSSEIAKRIERVSHNKADGEDLTAQLSNRELQIFDAIGRGMKTKHVAESLNLSVKTIESHRSHIKSKLGLRSGAELNRAAIVWVLEHS
ncbi:response regulator [Colwelliaceae bacterium 6471]